MTPSTSPEVVDDPAVATSRPGWVRRLWGYMLLHRRDLVLALAAAALSSVCQTIVPLVERQIVDAVIVTHTS
jgi:ATP-binding cassette subfamily B protein